jgi:hypothetical protein
LHADERRDHGAALAPSLTRKEKEHDMKHSPKTVLERINKVIAAWEALRPQSTFAGMTLAEFRDAVRPSLESRSRLTEAKNIVSASVALRDDADGNTVEFIKRVIAGVKADGTAGEDSEIYKTMGYVRSSDRQSGLTRVNRAVSTPRIEESIAAK